MTNKTNENTTINRCVLPANQHTVDKQFCPIGCFFFYNHATYRHQYTYELDDTTCRFLYAVRVSRLHSYEPVLLTLLIAAQTFYKSSKKVWLKAVFTPPLLLNQPRSFFSSSGVRT